ncbi:hypothetical protein EXN66_Car021540 [Channa argus]|uniref:Uncharacterized protein n=1 Tax=Channa argus TaxID=215402 RepID=A0A6G1QU59_CHAAH|nr:hypothetical protein EXN66_Car021540 [Channa argus]
MPFLTQLSPIITGLGPALHSWGWEWAVRGSVSCPETLRHIAGTGNEPLTLWTTALPTELSRPLQFQTD